MNHGNCLMELMKALFCSVNVQIYGMRVWKVTMTMENSKKMLLFDVCGSEGYFVSTSTIKSVLCVLIKFQWTCGDMVAFQRVTAITAVNGLIMKTVNYFAATM